MTSLAWLLPAALFLGLTGLFAFLWALRNGQFDDLEGAGWRGIDDEMPRDVIVAKADQEQAQDGKH